MRASLLPLWWNHSTRTSGASRCTARANPRPPLLLSTIACGVPLSTSIRATSSSVTSIGSRVWTASVTWIVPAASTA